MLRIKENSIALYTILRREIVRFLRIWTQTLLPPVITMGLYFLIFGNLIGVRIGDMAGFSYIEYIIPGLIMMSVITNSYANVVASFFGSKFQRNLEEMLVSPVHNSIIVLGYVLGGVARGLAVGFLVVILSLFFARLPFINILIVLIVGLLTSILFSLAGLLNGIFAKKFDDINIVPTFILSPLTYLGGVFYSISLLPPFWQKVTYFNPVFYMVNAFRYGMLGYSDISLAVALGVIISIIVILYAVTLSLMNRGVGIRT